MVLEVKPWEAGADLKGLFEKIRVVSMRRYGSDCDKQRCPVLVSMVPNCWWYGLASSLSSRTEAVLAKFVFVLAFFPKPLCLHALF